jgi:methylthioribose-1-phosphate isomerase
VINNEENLEKIKEKILQEALKICEEDIKANMKIAENGEKLIEDDDIILTHCNTGALATVGIGTALGIIAKAAESKKIQVIVSETRPKLQGSRLTAWELKKLGIPYKIIPDSAVGIVMKKRMVKKVLVGADRIFLSGHVINKIGTLSIALIANYYKIPFYVAAPTSTIDTKNKVEDVKIEERGKEEVIKIKRFYIAPKDAEVLNLAFDITDPELIDAIITERGIAFRPVNASLVNLLSLT